MQCHASPIYTLARNPSFCKNFITVGDWNARIWSEDCKESSIIWTKYCSVDLTDGCWSPTKCSLFYLSRIDGNLEAWDLLQQQSEPILTIKVRMHFLSFTKHSTFPLFSLSHKRHGEVNAHYFTIIVALINAFIFAIFLQISDHSIKCVKPHESGRMIACGCANGSVHLMEVSENMTFSAKNDKAILNAVS
jgi:dynein intermediate chain 2, axonemal